jgi:CRP-like cAMP-binding protein
MGRFDWIFERLEAFRPLWGKSEGRNSHRGRFLVTREKAGAPNAQQNWPLVYEISGEWKPTSRIPPQFPQRPIEGMQHRQLESFVISFWDALDPIGREALRSIAYWRTFPAGAVLIREGDRTDHVMVILGGRTKICVHENGEERILAERGRGQLVGERAALEVSVRSATVIALEMVWALVVETADFAAFISSNPGVLSIVQDQLYGRLIEGRISRRRTGEKSASREAGPFGSSRPGGQRIPDLAAEHARQNLAPLEGQNCTVFLTDVVEFGASARNDHDRLLIRKALYGMRVLANQSFPNPHLEDRGDGLLAVIPPEISTARVLEWLLTVLPTELGRTDISHRPSAQFKLRLAINVGPVVSDEGGVSGEAIIIAARLVEAPKFKDAIAGSSASLGVIASPFVYETVIRHSPDQSYVESYTQVPVEVKESSTVGWMKLIQSAPSLSRATQAIPQSRGAPRNQPR